MFNEREDKCGEITSRQGVAEGGEGERQTRKSNACFGGGLRHLCGLSPSGLPLANHLASSGFGRTQGPPLSAHLLGRMDSSARVSGKLTGCAMVWRPSFPRSHA